MLAFGLVSQLDLVTEPCDGCPSVFRLSESQRSALERAGGTVSQFRLLVALVVLAFAAGTYWLAYVLVTRSRQEALPVALGYLLVPLGTSRWIEDASLLEMPPLLAIPTRMAALGNYVAFFVLFAVFPDGKWTPRWARWAVGAIAAWAAAVYLTPLVEDLATGRDPVALIDAAVFLGGLVLVLVWQVQRYRSGDSRVRGAIRWVATALAGVLVVFVPLVLVVRSGADTDPRIHAASIGLAVLAFYLVVCAITVAVVRHRLWDVDVIVNRMVVYGGLTLFILAIYALLVTLVSGPARSYRSAVAVAGALAVALVLQPLRRRLQDLADRLLFGERAEPAVLSEALAGASEADPVAMLTATAKAISYALKLPHVALTVNRPDAMPLVAEAGESRADDVTLPIVVGSEGIGSLSVALRRGQRRFTRADHRALAGVAVQAGATAAMVRLALDLQRSRHALVSAREEERQRIRRDLHDGLGPTLAGVAHRLERLRTTAAHHPDLSEGLASSESDVRRAFDDVRRLVRGLRPPVLDQLGLVGAIEVTAEDLGLEVTTAATTPQRLPAAVEVAAYRIASEALSNVARHAAVDGARVTIAVVQGDLVIEIVDCGVGLPEDFRSGVGVQSMRERAAELGGTCRLQGGDGAVGTVVTARLPLNLVGPG
ncbi:MAG: histidine kinase [Actinomycetota bacterium]|nr:histidine kinase [Actinomycetota bacterium]